MPGCRRARSRWSMTTRTRSSSWRAPRTLLGPCPAGVLPQESRRGWDGFFRSALRRLGEALEEGVVVGRRMAADVPVCDCRRTVPRPRASFTSWRRRSVFPIPFGPTTETWSGSWAVEEARGALRPRRLGLGAGRGRGWGGTESLSQVETSDCARLRRSAGSTWSRIQRPMSSVGGLIGRGGLFPVHGDEAELPERCDVIPPEFFALREGDALSSPERSSRTPSVTGVGPPWSR